MNSGTDRPIYSVKPDRIPDGDIVEPLAPELRAIIDAQARDTIEAQDLTGCWYDRHDWTEPSRADLSRSGTIVAGIASALLIAGAIALAVSMVWP